MNRFRGTTAPSMWTVVCGRMLAAGCGVMPNAISMAACAMSRTPREATSLASGAELRSGRYTAYSVSAPTARTNSRASGTASPMGRLASLPLFSAQNAYPPSMAMAPVERLMTPDPR